MTEPMQQREHDKAIKVVRTYKIVSLIMVICLLITFVANIVHSRQMDEYVQSIQEYDYLVMSNIMVSEEILYLSGVSFDKIMKLREAYTENPCKETAEKYAEVLKNIVDGIDNNEIGGNKT